MSGALRELPLARELWLPTHVMEYYTAEDMLAFTEELRRKSDAYDALVADADRLATKWVSPMYRGMSEDDEWAVLKGCAQELARLLPDPNPARQIGGGD